MGGEGHNCKKCTQAKQQNSAKNKTDSIKPYTWRHTAKGVLACLLCLLLPLQPLPLLPPLAAAARLEKRWELNLRMFSPPVCNLPCGAAAHSAAQDMWSCKINATIQHQTNALRSPHGNHYFLFNVLYGGRALLYMKKNCVFLIEMERITVVVGGGAVSPGIINILADAVPSIFQSISAFVVTYIKWMPRLRGSGWEMISLKLHSRSLTWDSPRWHIF